MNKVLLLLGLLFITAFGEENYPNAAVANTYPHGNYSDQTETCGECHSLHRGTSYRLLRGSTLENTCFLCHDGTQSNYDVKQGVYNNGTAEVDSPAGGFDPSFGFTSSHLVGQKSLIPGGTSTIFSLVCTSCHNPHGTNNHRNLQKTVNGTGDITVTTQIAGPGRTVTTASGKEIISYESGVIDFCTACHADYKTYNSPDTYGLNDRWRHRVDVPLTGGINASFPEPGLYTTLPTQGPPTGAYITNYSTSAGSLSGIYNYLVTSYNLLGESMRGNIQQVSTGSNSVTLTWDAITNAVVYRIYRASGSGDPSAIPLSDFKFLVELGDDTNTYVDTGAVTPDPGRTPPTTTTTKLICLTCHYAHGTKTTDVLTGYTYLRRIDNMGICQNCHKR